MGTDKGKRDFRRGQLREEDISNPITVKTVRMDVPDVPSVFLVEFDKNGKYKVDRLK